MLMMRSGRCEPSVQKLIANLTYEDLITTPDGVTVSRGLVNVVINQQIGQQISVSTALFTSGPLSNSKMITRLTLSVRCYKCDVVHSVVRMM